MLNRFKYVIVVCLVVAASFGASLARPEPADAFAVSSSWAAQTVWLNRGETRWVASWGALAAIGLTFDWRLAAYASTFVWTANQAQDRGGCLKIIIPRFKYAAPYPQWYWGGFCR